MNKTVRNLAIAALFVFPGLSGFPQEVQDSAASDSVISPEKGETKVGTCFEYVGGHLYGE